MEEWFLCGESGEVLGPFPTTLIVRGIAAGKIPRSTFGWSTSWGPEWTPVLDVDDFADAFDATNAFGVMPLDVTLELEAHDLEPITDSTKPGSGLAPSVRPPPPPRVPRDLLPPSSERPPQTLRAPMPIDRRWQEAVWYVKVDGAERGPGTLDQICRNLQQGAFASDVQIRRAEESRWRAASEVIAETSFATRTPPPASPPSAPWEGRAGDTVAGKYRLLRRLGSGPTGRVYEAIDESTKRSVALKVIDRALPSPERIDRLRRELRAIASLDTPSYVEVIEIGEDPRAGVFVVTELLRGEDLASYLRKREGKLSVRSATKIAIRIAKSLVRAHGLGVTHGDLKPSNVFLVEGDDEEPVKIVDFGMWNLRAEAARADRRPGIALDVTRAGNPRHLAPEQALGLRDVDPRADAWALGVMLYEMIAGRPPYPEKETDEESLLALLTTTAPNLATVAPEVPKAVATIVDGMLDRDRSKRLADLYKIAQSLAAARDKSDRPSAPKQPVHDALAKQPTQRTRPGAIPTPPRPLGTSRARFAVVAAIVGTAVLLLAFVIGRKSAEPSPKTSGSVTAP